MTSLDRLADVAARVATHVDQKKKEADAIEVVDATMRYLNQGVRKDRDDATVVAIVATWLHPSRSKVVMLGPGVAFVLPSLRNARNMANPKLASFASMAHQRDAVDTVQHPRTMPHAARGKRVMVVCPALAIKDGRVPTYTAQALLVACVQPDGTTVIPDMHACDVLLSNAYTVDAATLVRPGPFFLPDATLRVDTLRNVISSGRAVRVWTFLAREDEEEPWVSVASASLPSAFAASPSASASAPASPSPASSSTSSSQSSSSFAEGSDAMDHSRQSQSIAVNRIVLELHGGMVAIAARLDSPVEVRTPDDALRRFGEACWDVEGSGEGNSEGSSEGSGEGSGEGSSVEVTGVRVCDPASTVGAAFRTSRVLVLQKM